MSHEDSDNSAVETCQAEFRDGQLQIVEVTPYEGNTEGDIEAAVKDDDNSDGKYLKVYDSESKSLMQLDLLNLTLVRCEGEDGDQYRLVTQSESEVGTEFLKDDFATVTCVLQSSDGDEQDCKNYVMVEGEDEDQEVDSSSYVMIEGEQGIMLLQSETQPKKEKEEKPPQTSYDALERAKALRKAKRLIAESLLPQRGRGRRRKYEMPTAQELLSSPKFKLFLYSCKMCSFKCNAVRELTDHRSQCHAGASGASARPARGSPSLLQCPRCPLKATTHYQLMKHAQQTHQKTQAQSPIDAIAEAAPDSVLVCGACGFESVSRPDFREHIAHAHANMVAEEFITGDIE